MDIATLITVGTQLGLAAAAWRLANQLKAVVKAQGEQLLNHGARIEVLERNGA